MKSQNGLPQKQTAEAKEVCTSPKQAAPYVRHGLAIQFLHAWGWCMGMTQRDVVGREVGGGFMFGNACKN